MNLFVLVYSTVLFFILSPNVLFRIPFKGSKRIVAVTHAILFGIVLFFTQTHVIHFSENYLGLTEYYSNRATAYSHTVVSGTTPGSLPTSMARRSPGSPSFTNIPTSQLTGSPSPTPTPGSPSPTPGSPSPTPGSRSPTPGSPSPTPGSPSPTPGSPSPTPGSRSPTPGSPSPTPGSRSPTPGSPSPTPGYNSTKSNNPPATENRIVYYVAPSVITLALLAGIAIIITSRKQ